MRLFLAIRLNAIAFSLAVSLSCGGSGSAPPLVQNPVPSLASLTPQTGSQFTAGLTLDVHGDNFIASSVVQANGSSRPTTLVSGTELNATLLPGDLAVLGSMDISVMNPAPGGGVSNTASFDVVQAAPGVLRIVTVASDGTQSNADSVIASFSADGRFAAFDSQATNLVANDANASSDVFLRDSCLGVVTACTPSTTQVSVSSDGTPGNSLSSLPSISADGRYVAFYSLSDNLVPNDTNFAGDVFVRDTCAGVPSGCSSTTIRVSLADDGSESNYDVGLPLISGSGRFVVFSSLASNLVANDTNGFEDVFIRDTCLGNSAGCTPSTALISVASDGSQANNSGSAGAGLTADGRLVVFQSLASNLVPNDTNNTSDIFVRDTCFAAPTGCSPSTTRVSVANDGTEGNDGSYLSAISSGGRYISFTSLATNLVPNDTNGKYDVFLRDTCFGVTTACIPSTTRVSIATDGSEGNGDSLESSVSADGRFVVFASVASNLVPNDTNGSDDVFVRDTCNGAAAGCTPSTYRISITADGSQGDAHSYQGVISPDGRFILFRSIASDLVSADQNGFSDFFIAFN